LKKRDFFYDNLNIGLKISNSISLFLLVLVRSGKLIPLFIVFFNLFYNIVNFFLREQFKNLKTYVYILLMVKLHNYIW